MEAVTAIRTDLTLKKNVKQHAKVCYLIKYHMAGGENIKKSQEISMTTAVQLVLAHLS